MWMNDSPVALSSLTKKDYLDGFISQIERQEYGFFREILKNIFILDSGKRIKVDTLLKKLRKEYKLHK
jgi:hypothetical protein